MVAEGNKKKREEEAMTTMNLPDLPVDLIVDILLRLPVKSLKKFMCVSKFWCARITDPAFIKMHLSRSLASNSNLNLIFIGSSLYSVNLDACEQQTAVELDHPLNSPLYKEEGQLKLLGSCNGLLCISKAFGDLRRIETYEEDIFLWNPSTQSQKKLPNTPIEFPISAWDPHRLFYGFGYDPTTDDYKLVRIERAGVMRYGSWNSEVKVYSLSTNSWRKWGAMPFQLFGSKHVVFVNSALHWTALPLKSSYGDPCVIIAFDLKNEESRELPLPDCGRKMHDMVLGVLEGQFCMLWDFTFSFEIWVMKDYGVRESWVKQFFIERLMAIRPNITPIFYSKNGEIIFYGGRSKDSKMFYRYDPHRRRGRNIRIRGVPCVIKAEICVESLVSLDAKDGTQQAKKEEEEKETEVNVDSRRLAMN